MSHEIDHVEDPYEEALRLGQEDAFSESEEYDAGLLKRTATEANKGKHPDTFTEENIEGDWFSFSDVAKGVGNGFFGAFQAMGSLLDTGLEWIGIDIVEDDSFFETSVFGKTETLAGGLAEGLTQFGVSWFTAGGLLGGLLKKVPGLAAAPDWLLKGAATDFLAFKGNEANLSNLMIEQFEGTPLDNPITQMLSNDTDADDDKILGRVKNTLEGMGMGFVFAKLGKALSGMHTARVVKSDEAKEVALKKVMAAFDKTGRDSKLQIDHVTQMGKDGGTLDLQTRITTADNMLEADKEELKETVKRLLAGGQPLENTDAADLAKIADILNLKHLKSDGDITNVISTLGEYVKPNLPAQITPETHKEVWLEAWSKVNSRLFSDDLAGSLKMSASEVADGRANLNKLLATQEGSGKAATDMASNIIVGKIILQSMTEQSRTYAQMLAMMPRSVAQTADALTAAAKKAGKTVDAAEIKSIAEQTISPIRAQYEEALDNTIGVLLYQTEQLKIQITGAARATSAGNIDVGASKAATKRMDDILSEIKESGGIGSMDEGMVERLALSADSENVLAAVGMSQSFKARLGDAGLEYYVNSLLGGFSTQQVNITSNIINMFMMPTERVIGGIAQGNKKEMMRGLRTFTGMAMSINESIKMANKAFWKGSSQLDAVTKFDGRLPKSIHMESVSKTQAPFAAMINGLGTAVRIPSRMLNTTDEFFKQMMYRGDLHARMVEQGINTGVKSADLGRYVAEKIQASFSKQGRALDLEGLRQARRATFTTPIDRSTSSGKVQTALENIPFGAGRFIVPFYRTPVNIVNEVIAHTPLLQKISTDNMRIMAKGTPAEMAELSGRIGMGNLLFTGGMIAAVNGTLSGGGPRDANQRHQLMATGWRPYSIKVGDNWIELKRFDPYASIIGIAADIAEMGHDIKDDELASLSNTIATSLSANLSNKTYLRGLTDFMNAVINPEKTADGYFEGLAATMIPNLARDVSFTVMGQDDLLRETRSAADAIMKKIPGYAQSLDARRDLLGKELSADTGILFGRMDAIKVSPVKHDLVRETIAKLPVPTANPAKKMEGIDLTVLRDPVTNQSAYDRHGELVGTIKISGKTLYERLDDLVRSDRFKNTEVTDIDGNVRAKLIQQMIGRYRMVAKRKLLKDYPALNARMVALKLERRRAAEGQRALEYRSSTNFQQMIKRESR